MMAPSYRRALVASVPAEIEFEIYRINRMMRSCGWKSEKIGPLYARLQEIKMELEWDNMWFGNEA